MKRETIAKIRKCKALQNVSLIDICKGEKFITNLEAYFDAQKADREAIRKSFAAMQKIGGPRGLKLPAHALDHLAGLSVEELANEFLLIVQKISPLPANQRLYIEQICQQAYNLTIAQIVVEEFPELEAELLPKSQKS